MVDPWSVFCPAFLFWPTWEHISKYVIPILLRMQRACCFSEMAVLRGMICFRRNDAGADRIPNNNHLAMNISPGRVVARMTISQVSDLAHKDIFHFVRFIFFFFPVELAGRLWETSRILSLHISTNMSYWMVFGQNCAKPGFPFAEKITKKLFSGHPVL